MMKLKYLFDNRDLALMLLENWEYDKDKLNLLDKYRISANAVYPFMKNQKLHFLRFSPAEEKLEKDLLAELKFLDYLHSEGYPAASISKTKSQQQYVMINTPWGEYIAVAFESVSGKQLNMCNYSDELYYEYGKSLGQLHKLSRNYKPEGSIRDNWEQRLNWTKDILIAYYAPENSIAEVDILLNYFNDVEINSDNYGLIHYDYEFDNVFFDNKTHMFNVIDFDDSLYHWFAMDIEKCLDSIDDELPERFLEAAKDNFLSGYQSQIELSSEMKKLFPVFRRYANIYSYARCLRSLYETWENEPEWMVLLRKKVEFVNFECQRNFGRNVIL